MIKGENRVVGHIFDSCPKSQLNSLFFFKIDRTFSDCFVWFCLALLALLLLLACEWKILVVMSCITCCPMLMMLCTFVLVMLCLKGHVLLSMRYYISNGLSFPNGFKPFLMAQEISCKFIICHVYLLCRLVHRWCIVSISSYMHRSQYILMKQILTKRISR